MTPTPAAPGSSPAAPPAAPAPGTPQDGPAGIADAAPPAAAPWLRRFHGSTVVVKFGGNAMAGEELKRAFARDVVALREAGVRPVVVHGGGPQISSLLSRLGLEVRFTAGLRVTTPDVLDVVRMVLAGRVQREIVGLVNEHGPFAVGMTGEDAHTLTAVRRPAWVGGEPVDIGLVGDVVQVDPETVGALLERGRIPVVSPLARGAGGEVFNVNADLAAAALAGALGAERLVVLTDVAGLYADWPAGTDVVERLTASELEALMPGLTDGMAPKMEGCLRAVRHGVRTAQVVDGRVPHALLSAFSGGGGGTTVTPDPVRAAARPAAGQAAGSGSASAAGPAA